MTTSQSANQCIIYVGDGRGDFCPSLRLQEGDHVLAREGYAGFLILAFFTYPYPYAHALIHIHVHFYIDMHIHADICIFISMYIYISMSLHMHIQYMHVYIDDLPYFI